MNLNLAIIGMSCEHCVKHVSQALSEIPGLTVLDVNLEGAKVQVESSVTENQIKTAVEDAGYELEGVSRSGDN